jgi:hypothetical protein
MRQLDPTGTAKLSAWALAIFVTGALCAGSAATAAAQESRSAAIEQSEAERARTASPYQPGKIEKIINYVDSRELVQRLDDGDGFFPRLGGITTGGGFALGAGYRRHVLDDRLRLETSFAQSFKGYREIAGDVLFPQLFGGRMLAGTEITYRKFPQEDFFGLGNDTVEDARANYRIQGTDFSGMAAYRPRPWFSAGTRIGVLDVELGSGSDSAYPSIEALFSAAETPGFAAQPDFRYGELFADVDTRDERGNPRSGGHYRFGWLRYSDLGLYQFNFSRVTVEASQFLPIFDKKRVFMVRFRTILTNPDEGNDVPFFMMPALGGSHTLRSVDDFRFRDNNLILLNAEYRWETFTGLDMALFADAGKVTADRGDVDLTGLRKAYGIGFRFGTYHGTFFRFDVGHGQDGFRFYVKFSGPFHDREPWPADSRSHIHRGR